MPTTTTVHLRSLGQLSADFQRSVPSIRDAASRAGVRPALVLNDAALFDDAGVEAIRKALDREDDCDA